MYRAEKAEIMVENKKSPIHLRKHISHFLGPVTSGSDMYTNAIVVRCGSDGEWMPTEEIYMA